MPEASQPNSNTAASDAFDLKSALEQALDTADKRAKALQLVAAWRATLALGHPCRSLLELLQLAQELFDKPQPPQDPARQLIDAAQRAAALAVCLAASCSDADLRSRCFGLARHCSSDVACIKRQLLWAEQP